MMQRRIAVAFLTYAVPFLGLMVLYDFFFQPQVDWFRNVLSAVVFGALMTYFRIRR